MVAIREVVEQDAGDGMKKPYKLTWWDDSKQAPQSQGAKTLDSATITAARIERKTGNPVHIEICK